jgi:hypothetical protein
VRKGAALAALAGGFVLAAAGFASADAGAGAAAVGSPGVLSGNVVQVPVDVPVNVCGNSVGILALLNPAAGNTCATVSAHRGAQASSGTGAQTGGGNGSTPGDDSGDPSHGGSDDC